MGKTTGKRTMKIQKINLQNNNETSAITTPSKKDFKKWALAALLKDKSTQITIRLVNEAESQRLNAQFRQKNAPTNVLSFPYENTAKKLIGDLAICPDVVAKEAAEQKKTLTAHYAHLSVHGVLHLQGFDHQTELDAQNMETLEIQILKSLGFPNPYE